MQPGDEADPTESMWKTYYSKKYPEKDPLLLLLIVRIHEIKFPESLLNRSLIAVYIQYLLSDFPPTATPSDYLDKLRKLIDDYNSTADSSLFSINKPIPLMLSRSDYEKWKEDEAKKLLDTLRVYNILFTPSGMTPLSYSK
jgi:hypothetical protein